MYLITRKENNAVIQSGERLEYVSNGYPRLVNEDVAYPNWAVCVYEIDNIPNDISPEKWCYTEADGFYPNPNWHEPSAYDLAPQDIVDAIIDEYTNELIEMGVL